MEAVSHYRRSPIYGATRLTTAYCDVKRKARNFVGNANRFDSMNLINGNDPYLG